jgi:hypothetical protein
MQLQLHVSAVTKHWGQNGCYMKTGKHVNCAGMLADLACPAWLDTSAFKQA